MITAHEDRDAAAYAGAKALSERVDVTPMQLAEALADWRLVALKDGETPVGMIMGKDNEIHIAVVPAYRGYWYSRRLYAQIIGPILRQFGRMKTSVCADNIAGQIFVERFGFSKSGEASGIFRYVLEA